MKDRVALLSQDAASDEEFAGVDSIVSQGVRSTICAPLVAESRVHGALYADRLDPFAAFKPDDLELISAVAAQTAIGIGAALFDDGRAINRYFYRTTEILKLNSASPLDDDMELRGLAALWILIPLT